MLIKVAGAAVALAVFLLGAYTEAEYTITPAVSAAGGTGVIMAQDLYAGVIRPYLERVHYLSLIVSVAGFSVLLLFKFLFRARRL
ncbi:MAG: hypothetical protein JL50_06690 [Peptococcaceae bacterium BICA1-7]|nr:MAG: hypothetical protein JL50_06690 [Peptococcaceae bacterium BICA1-7]HBV99246.1 hypothetical protein [Desulfotomaculum sp.]